ncbi:uncharacterized protein LOC127724577 [Mytilus californianus]|uniref:uncharacterized protein LOC127724577 n=1 Tax=Mytilus californianus TaxID=6549 RepID=UPI00224764B7|nr:uncharacterized protein LOC127724577 [Mytilus californianus]
MDRNKPYTEEDDEAKPKKQRMDSDAEINAPVILYERTDGTHSLKNIDPSCTDMHLDDELDEVSNISTLHLSFLVNLLIPNHLMATKEQAESDMEKLNARLHQEYKSFQSNCIFVGSNAERYQIPRVVSKQPGKEAKGIHYSDIDILMVWDVPSIKELDSKSIKQNLVLETENVHPGYCRVFVNDPETVLRDLDPSTALCFDEKLFYNAKKVRDDMKIVADLYLMKQSFDQLKVDQKGPALGLEDITERTLETFLSNVRPNHPRHELVPALPIVWPRIADNWRFRPRNNGWLTDELIKSIVNEGCHAVPVPHRHSEHPDIEWRLSFATSEVRLAKEVVNDDQRKCLMYLKVLRHETMNKFELLSSYHFKTAFLYACDRIPLKSWRENPGFCILYVLDTLLDFVRNRFLPSYFVQENNLLDHLKEDEFLILQTILESVRSDPVIPILNFTDVNVVGMHSATETFRNIIQGVIEDSVCFKQNKNKTTSMNVFRQTLHTFIFHLFVDDKVEAVVRYVGDFFEFFRVFYQMDSFSKYFESFTIHWEIISQSIRYFEIAINLFSCRYTGVNSFHGNLGALYFASSFQCITKSELSKKALNNAKHHFDQYISELGLNTQVAVHFTLFLRATGKIDLCIELLNKIIQNENENPKNCYNLSTVVILEANLRRNLKDLLSESPERRIIAIPAISLAYYLLSVVTFQHRNHDEIMDNILDKFNAHCQDRNTFLDHYLFSLCLQNIKKWKLAEVSFQKTVDILLESDSLSCLHELSCHIDELIKVCRIEDLLSQGKVGETCEYIVETILEPFGKDSLHLVENVACLISAPSRNKFLNDIFPQLQQHCGNESMFYGILARLHFRSAFDSLPDSEDRYISIAKADTLFSTFLSEEENKMSATVVDYALFLCYQERWSESADLLQKFICQKFPLDQSTCYDIKQYDTLDDMLKKEIEIHSQIKAHTKAFAYLFLIKSLVKMGEVQNVERAKEEFAEFCEEIEEDRLRSYSLLGYSELQSENWSAAEHWFYKAVQGSWHYTAAKQNVAFCRSKMPKLVNSIYTEKYLPFCIAAELKGMF